MQLLNLGPPPTLPLPPLPLPPPSSPHIPLLSLSLDHTPSLSSPLPPPALPSHPSDLSLPRPLPPLLSIPSLPPPLFPLLFSRPPYPGYAPDLFILYPCLPLPSPPSTLSYIPPARAVTYIIHVDLQLCQIIHYIYRLLYCLLIGSILRVVSRPLVPARGLPGEEGGGDNELHTS